MPILAERVDVVIGVDTHTHTHTCAVLDARTQAVLETLTTASTTAGCVALVAVADRYPARRVWAIEGTNSYGAGLTRVLTARGEQVIELDRPKRPRRRHGAKTDELDAVRAAREVLTRDHLGEPRRDGDRSALSCRLMARRSAVTAAGDTQRQLRALVITAPAVLRDQLRDRSTIMLVKACAELVIEPGWDTHTEHTAYVLAALARRSQQLTTEARDHHHAIEQIVRGWRPDLLALNGVGPIVAATVLCAWSHPGRVRSEAAFAMLAGTAPIPASSGMTNRHRLNRSGDRQLNRAIHTIALCRQTSDPETRAYTNRRRTEGRTDRDIRRCLKRYITRQLYHQLEHPPLDNP